MHWGNETRASLTFEGLLLVLALSALTVDAAGLSYWSITAEEAMAGAQRPFDTMQVMVTLSLQALYVMVNLPAALKAAKANLLLLGLALFCLLSTFWSINPPLTFNAAASLVISLAFLITAQKRHGTEKLTRLFLGLTTAIVLVNLASLAVPSISLMTGRHEGAFRGLASHKNSFGPIMVVYLALLLGQARNMQWSPRWRLAMICLAPVTLALLMLSRSATSLVLASGLLVSALLLAAGRIMPAPLKLASGLVAAGAALLALNFLTIEDLFSLLGKDVSLTGRTAIWDFALRQAAERPVLGFGFKAFPLQELLERTPAAVSGLSWVVGSTHSAFIELFAELGVAGAALYAGFVLGLVRRNLCLAPGPQRRTAFFVILAYLAAGFSESIAGLDMGLPLLALLVTAMPAPRRTMTQQDAVIAHELTAPAVSR